jgi:hypothetical protein
MHHAAQRMHAAPKSSMFEQQMGGRPPDFCTDGAALTTDTRDVSAEVKTLPPASSAASVQLVFFMGKASKQRLYNG